MFEKNTLQNGLIMGSIIPILGFGTLLLFFSLLENSGWASQEGFAPNFRMRTVMLIAICLNLIPMNMFYSRRLTDSMRGVVLATFVFGVIWILLFNEQFFNPS